MLQNSEVTRVILMTYTYIQLEYIRHKSYEYLYRLDYPLR